MEFFNSIGVRLEKGASTERESKIQDPLDAIGKPRMNLVSS